MDTGETLKVCSFDGQTVWYDQHTALFEVGNFLGGGAAGTVYECEYVKTHEHFALKILNPIGFKMMTPALIRKCAVVVKGKVVSDISSESEPVLTREDIWWLVNGSTKQFLGAYYSEKQNSLKELSLSQCIQIYGPEPAGVGEDDSGDADATVEIVQTPEGPRVYVPSIPPKYADFVRKRCRIFREIRNMRKISSHLNVIRLEGVLELTQETKCTIFLVMELANGGELFDRIKIDYGTREGTAKYFFMQLLEGVRHCHEQGVCHRDLKPEVSRDESARHTHFSSIMMTLTMKRCIPTPNPPTEPPATRQPRGNNTQNRRLWIFGSLCDGKCFEQSRRQKRRTAASS